MGKNAQTWVETAHTAGKTVLIGENAHNTAQNAQKASETAHNVNKFALNPSKSLKIKTQTPPHPSNTPPQLPRPRTIETNLYSKMRKI